MKTLFEKMRDNREKMEKASMLCRALDHRKRLIKDSQEKFDEVHIMLKRFCDAKT